MYVFGIWLVILSPKSGIKKRYYATVEGRLLEEDVQKFRAGLVLRDGSVCLPALLERRDRKARQRQERFHLYGEVRIKPFGALFFYIFILLRLG